MWEWRIFYKSADVQFFNEKIESAFGRAPLESRTDDYLDFDKIQFGLKERDINMVQDETPLLELKIRLDRTTWGAELWCKTIKIPLSKRLKDKPEIEIESISHIIEDDEENLNKYYISQHREFLEYFRNSRPRHFEMQKERHQITAIFNYSMSEWQYLDYPDHFLCEFPPYALLVEKVRFPVKNKLWTSVAIESMQLDALHRFMELFIPKIHGVKDYIMGYPEFIHARLAGD